MSVARVLVVEDEAGIRLALSGLLKREGYEVIQCERGADALAQLGAGAFDFVLTDLALGEGPSGLDVLRFAKERQPETPIVMITAHGSEKIAVEAMKLGAEDYVPKPFDNDEIRLVVRRALERTHLARENRMLRARVEREFGMGNLVGRGPGMRAVFDTIRKVAETDLTVLIRGESGTGKELVAQALHEASARKSGPFVAVNCAAISRELVESELFGHEKGAFTGADARRIGRFEAAHGGTIFLDEIGDMSPTLQVKLLRVLQDRTFEPVGSSNTVKVDVRVIAATHQKLDVAIREKRFREDLYYRLNVIPIELPPLRDRRTDIPLLVDHFLKRFNDEFRRNVTGVSEAAMQKLQAYSWPGNVRELRNVMERAVLLAQGPLIHATDLPLHLPVPGAADRASASAISLAELERRHIESVLHETSWHQGRAASTLGISSKTLYRKIREYGFRRPGGLE
jgi:DNA-binding NtrC family response regulator